MRTWTLSSLVLLLGGASSTLGACLSNGANPPAPAPLDGSFQPDDAAPPFDASGPVHEGDSAPATGDDAGGVLVSDAGPGDASFVDPLAPSSWSVFDVGSLDSGVTSFDGVTFDGRYVYYAPQNRNGVVVRFDTQAAFASPSAWTTFDTLPSIPESGGFGGAIFDGRYVYFVPFYNTTSKVNDGFDQTFVRYDTQGSFSAATSWTSYDGVQSGPYYGAAFDGKTVYFTPRFNGPVVMFDTTGSFTDSSAWTAFETSNLNPATNGTGVADFASSIFDGKYVYFLGPIVVRHDTTALPDAGASSWASFDVRGLVQGGSGIGFFNFGGFDGRYVYLLNQDNDQIVRYDTQADFAATASWTTFDVATAGGGTGGFQGGNFDGRHMYFAPHGTTVAILDTQAPFNAASSWATFDTSKVITVPNGYESTLYDGQYLYLAAQASSVMLRLQVKSGPGALPALPQYHGSFF